MRCPVCGSSGNVIRSGSRTAAKGKVQKYLCRGCGRYFSSSLHPYSRYPDKVIVQGFELYNSGYSVKDIRVILKEDHGIDIPGRTLYSWLKRYEKRFDLYLNKGRRSGLKDPIIRGKALKWDPVIDFRYHVKKLDALGRDLSELKNYIFWVENEFPSTAHGIFSDRFPMKECRVTAKDNGDDISRTMDLIMRRYDDPGKKEIQDFFLMNHPGCVAASLPVFSEDEEDKPWLSTIGLVLTKDRKVRLVVFPKENSSLEEKALSCMMKMEAFGKRTAVDEERISCSLITDEGVKDICVH